MNYLLTSVTTCTNVKAKELALSAIAATAHAAKKDIIPYFQQIVKELTVFLQAGEDEAQVKLQTQSIGEHLQCDNTGYSAILLHLFNPYMCEIPLYLNQLITADTP